jgi:hypothetical protein
LFQCVCGLVWAWASGLVRPTGAGEGDRQRGTATRCSAHRRCERGAGRGPGPWPSSSRRDRGWPKKRVGRRERFLSSYTYHSAVRSRSQGKVTKRNVSLANVTHWFS